MLTFIWACADDKPNTQEPYHLQHASTEPLGEMSILLTHPQCEGVILPCSIPSPATPGQPVAKAQGTRPTLPVAHSRDKVMVYSKGQQAGHGRGE